MLEQIRYVSALRGAKQPSSSAEREGERRKKKRERIVRAVRSVLYVDKLVYQSGESWQSEQ